MWDNGNTHIFPMRVEIGTVTLENLLVVSTEDDL